MVVAEAAVALQQLEQQQQPQAQSHETAAAEDDTAAVQVAAAAATPAAEIDELHGQVQRLDRQLNNEIGFSSGLLNAQPGLAGAVTRRKQMAAAANKTEAPVFSVSACNTLVTPVTLRCLKGQIGVSGQNVTKMRNFIIKPLIWLQRSQNEIENTAKQLFISNPPIPRLVLRLPKPLTQV